MSDLVAIAALIIAIGGAVIGVAFYRRDIRRELKKDWERRGDYPGAGGGHFG